MNCHLILKTLTLTSLIFAIASCGSDDKPKSSSPSSGTSTPTTPSVSPPVAYMWISNTTSNGDLGGITGAHGLCQTDSAAVTFPTSVTTHRAALITATNDPSTYFTEHLVKRPDGTVITAKYPYFWSDSNIINSVAPGFGTYWIGNTGLHCDNWTSSSGAFNGGMGNRNVNTTGRYGVGLGSTSCNNTRQVLCISH